MGPFLFFTLIATFGAKVTYSTSDCPSILKQAGATEKFAERVVHAIHAITVADLKIFEPDATEKNRVPTVNRDHGSSLLVLPYAPDLKTEDGGKFNTTTMKLLDSILSHIDDREYFESDYTLIEQIVHTAHMQEHWIHVKVHYDNFKKSHSSIDEKLCQCALDVENNGILDILDFAANRTYQEINKGEVTIVDQGTLRYSRLDSHTKYSCDGPLSSTRQKRGINALICIQNQKAANRLKRKALHEECSTPVTSDQLNLVGSAAWALYKKRLNCLENHYYDAALFLYCALKGN